MLGARMLVLAVMLYLGALAWVGWRADRVSGREDRRWRGLRYGLSLATLCSAWTYFGAVGDASGGSWLFVANALGPVLALTVFAPVWRRIAVLAKQENVGSLADFLAARFGKSRPLGIVVTLVAMVGTLPYIALQLAVLRQVWAYAAGHDSTTSVTAWPLFLALVAMTIVFGTRSPNLTRHARGFVSMIAVESLVKLSGLLAVAGFCLWSLGGMRPLDHLPPFAGGSLSTFFILTFLCTVTSFTLPRQFHLGFVALGRTEDIDGARWSVPVYFGLWVLATMVIAGGIRGGLGVGGVSPYLQMLAMPAARGDYGIALLAWLGGVSAGGAMVVVELTAISAMVSNEIVLPLLHGLLRERLLMRPDHDGVGGEILLVRRITVVAVALMAWAYYIGVKSIEGPTELGLTALTAFAQLVPPLIGGIYWRRGHAHGALAGVCAGVAVWAVAIAAPAFFAAPEMGGNVWMALPWEVGRGGLARWAILFSLVVNIACYVGFSLLARPRLIDLIQAGSFVAAADPARDSGRLAIDASLGDLRRLLRQFLGEEEAGRAVLDIAMAARRGAIGDDQPVSPNMVRAAERVLAGVIGAPSARNVVAIALASGERDATEIGRLLDEAGHAVHFSRELLQTTLESLPQGVCVVDDGARVVAWNARFFALLGLGNQALHMGRSLEDALAQAGEAAMAATGWRAAQATGKALAQELAPGDGRVVSLAGRALAGGDYLLILTDITEQKQAEQMLESRVEERTAALNEARRQAEQASGAQRRFVAAASHDLVQPMHAARLFIGNALLSADDPDQRDLLTKADQAVEGAHRLLHALLKLSQLELGALRPQPQPVDAGALLLSLAAEFEPMAKARHLQLVILPTARWIRTDRDLLRSILQNLIVNALRYTPHGRVVVLARVRGDHLRLEVRDSGVGIADEQLPAAFREFTRLAQGQDMAEGAGLGLSIVARIAQALGHGIEVASRPGRGSTFAVSVPLTAPAPRLAPAPAPAFDLGGMSVLCLDDDEDVLAGTSALIARWGARVTACAGIAAVPEDGRWDVAIADYKLGEGDGLGLLRAIAGRCGARILMTATPEPGWADTLPREGIHLMAKPLPPLALRSLLGRERERLISG